MINQSEVLRYLFKHCMPMLGGWALLQIALFVIRLSMCMVSVEPSHKQRVCLLECHSLMQCCGLSCFQHTWSRGKGRTHCSYLNECKKQAHTQVHRPFFAIQACGILATNEETIVVEGRFTKNMSLKVGQALLADVEKEGFHTDIFVATALVNLLGKSGSIEDAENVCASLSEPDVVLWTAMLSAYIEQGQGEKALTLYMQMQTDCLLTLDDVIVVCVLQACGKTGSLEIARHLHFAIGFASHNLSCFLASALAYAYGSCASTGDVQAIFDGLSEPDLITWNACIAGYAGEGNLLASQRMAQEMQT